MMRILESLKSSKNRESTKRNYLCVWRQFNNFVIKLDEKPNSWEDRVSLYAAYLIQHGIQLATLKSYISAIKGILIDDGYTWNQEKLLINTLTKACKIINDRVRTRLPIKVNLLEILLFEVERLFNSQPYLECLYKTIFMFAYYGLFRIGELTTGEHPIKAKDVHIAQNKNQVLIILYSSKTHNFGSTPQEVKITGTTPHKFNFCPFKSSREYLAIRGNYESDNDPFFIFRDNKPVKPTHVRSVLKKTLKAVNLNPKLYDTHSFRIGHATEMLITQKLTISQVWLAGRWKSNVVYKYIRQN